MKKSPLQRLLLVGLSLISLVIPAGATWSIVVVNQRTGEVGIACATCIANFDLEVAVPMIVVGKGAAAAQSFIDMTGANRQFIFNALKNANADPQGILDSLALSDTGHQTRQYGILSMAGGGPVTFTGTGAGLAATGVTGQVGDYVYAIQGNVLTADSVIFAAELAFTSTAGDMGQRLMAAMEAARALGGDGRCSCSNMSPTSCGAPPPSFTKSAHTGFLIVSRMGDTDGGCNSLRGCSTGSYHLDLNVRLNAAGVGSLDPVLRLQRRYAAWRLARVGRPDAIQSIALGVDSLPADGLTQRSFTIQLVDLDGTPLSSGGTMVSVRHAAPGASIVQLGAVLDNGDGTYTFDVTAGTTAGLDQLIVNADDGVLSVDLFPFVDVRSDAPPALHQGYDSVSAAAGPVSLPLEFNVPTTAESAPQRRYVLLASLNGTSPGTHLGRGLLPLNEPLIILRAGHPVRHQSESVFGSLDSLGRASVLVDLDAGVLQRLMGQRLDFAAFYSDRGGPKATNSTGVQILP